MILGKIVKSVVGGVTNGLKNLFNPQKLMGMALGAIPGIGPIIAGTALAGMGVDALLSMTAPNNDQQQA